MVKTFKNLILQNRGRLGAESLLKSSGTGGLPKLLKNGPTLTFDLFTARSSLLPYAFVWENVENFKRLLPLEPLGHGCSNFIRSPLGAWK